MIMKYKTQTILLALLYVACACALSAFVPQVSAFPSNHVQVGWAAILCGLILSIWALLNVRSSQSLKSSKNPMVRFYTGGIFEISRQPVYLGVMLILSGVAFCAGMMMMFFAPLAYFLTVNSKFIPYEEKVMVRHFGESYQQYQQKVRCWI